MLRLVATLIVILAARVAAAQGMCGASPSPQYTANNASATYYNPTNAACGFPVTGQNPPVVAHVSTGGGQYFAAMNESDFGQGATCGACVEVTRDGTRNVLVTVVDDCPLATNPSCKPGHLDLSQQAFLQIGTTQEGYLGTGNGGAVGLLSWRYVPCPTTENVTFRLDPASNQYYLQLVVEGTRYALAKVEIFLGGVWQPATRLAYGWVVNQGNIGPGPYQLRATDINGDVVSGTVALSPGVDQPTSSQFPLCGSAPIVPALGAAAWLLAAALGGLGARAARRRPGG